MTRSWSGGERLGSGGTVLSRGSSVRSIRCVTRPACTQDEKSCPAVRLACLRTANNDLLHVGIALPGEGLQLRHHLPLVATALKRLAILGKLALTDQQRDVPAKPRCMEHALQDQPVTISNGD